MYAIRSYYGLLGLGSIGREAADEGLQFGDPFLGLGIGLRLALTGLLRRFHEVVVVARVGGDLAVA